MRISKHSIFFIILNYGQAFVAFAISFLLARNLDPVGYGLYSYGLLLGTILIQVGSFGEGKTLVRDLVQGEGDRVISSSLMLRGAATTVAGIFIAGWVCFSGDAAEEVFVVMLLVLAAVIPVFNVRALYDVSQRMWLHAGLGLFERCLFLGLCIYFSGWPNSLNFELEKIVVSLLVSRGAFLLMQWLWRPRNLDISFSRASLVGYLFRENYLIVIALIGNLAMSHFGQIMIKARVGLIELAYYSLAFQIVIFMRLFQVQVLRLSAKRIASLTGSVSEGSATVLPAMIRHLLLSFASTLLMVPFVYAAAWFFITNYLPEGYLHSLEILRVLLVWVCFYGPAIVVNQYMIGFRLHGKYVLITIIAGGISIVLSWYFVGVYGAVGVACALLISHFLSSLMQVVIVIRHIRNEKK